MADVLLGTPQSWTDQLLEVTLDELILSYYPKGLTWPADRSHDDVIRDLIGGVWLSRVPSSRDEIFRLGGAEFELHVRRRRGNGDGSGNGPWMAVVRSIDAAGSVPRKARVLPRLVKFAKVWEEASCDLADIEEMVRQRERQWREAYHRGARQQEVRAHGQLQNRVRSQYGELETLVTVLEQRPERPEETVGGIILPEQGRRRNGRPSIVVEPHDCNTSLFRGKRIQLLRNGASYNTQVTFVREGLLEIAEPRNWSGRPGEQVSVSIVRPFGMRQNAEALKRFKDGNIEGSWDDLARLLCKPSDLILPPLPPLSMFYCDDDPHAPSLNKEQRMAVTGAVASPHAFLIQGPPGTGKTEVISETIRQLVGRGERVLLLAPTHVAVDEVLGRIGRKPGIRPLRITWDDFLVDEDLRAFLPEQVGVELARQILRPTDHGQVARWERERAAVEARLMAVTQLRDVVRRHIFAVVAVRGAAQASAEAADRLGARVASAETETAELGRDLAEDERVLADAHAAARSATIFERDEWAALSPGLVKLWDSASELAASGGAADGAADGAERADAELRSWTRSHEAQIAQIVHSRRRSGQVVLEAQHHTDAADHAVAGAQATLAEAVFHQSGLGRIAEQLGFGRVAQARAAVAQAEQVAIQCRAEWARRHAAWRDVAAAHERLQDAGTKGRAALEQRWASADAVRNIANQRFADSTREFTSALASVEGQPESLRASTIAEWTRLGLVVHDALTMILQEPASTSAMPTIAGLEAVTDAVAHLRRATEQRDARERELSSATRRRNDRNQQLRQAQTWAAAEIERLTAERDAAAQALSVRQVELNTLVAERDRLVAELGFDDPAAGETALLRRRHVLERLPAMDARWLELAAERTDEQFVNDIQQSLIRATNVVCATTKGIVGRGSDVVRHTDYDTLIVDEASRVTESEFLIGAIRARRWVLVGDERQLPPHVDQEDEYFLHALTALHRAGRGAADTLDQAIDDLAEVWGEDEKERVYRKEPVLKIASDLDTCGLWLSTFRDQFVKVHEFFDNDTGDNQKIDKRILQAMRRYLVQSLFELAVAHSKDTLRQPLIIQRRMITPLTKIVKEPIYGGLYESASDAELAEVGVTPLVISRFFDRPATFLDTSRYDKAGDTPAQRGHGFVNELEQDFILRACEIYNEELRTPVTVSVLSFYLAQARELERRLQQMTLPMLRWEVIDVIDRIQGQQSDLVMISFTRASCDGFSDKYGQWLQDLRRLNVACTRARRALVLVGHAKTLRRLRTFDRARQFYANLLGLFDADRENFKRIHQLD